MPHKILLSEQLQLKRIQPIDSAAKVLRIAQEQYQLQRLMQAKSDYLNTYDQVFRLVSLWVLEQGFDLSNLQPHQVFKAVLRFHCIGICIEPIVQHRHELKKGHTTKTDIHLWEDLMNCHAELSRILQACNLIQA